MSSRKPGFLGLKEGMASARSKELMGGPADRSRSPVAETSGAAGLTGGGLEAQRGSELTATGLGEEAGRRTVRERRRWPNLFIVGTAKAATTSLYRYLRQHPDVYMSSLKEPNFFLGEDPGGGQSYVGDEDSYLKLFNGASTEKVLGEASVQYLWKPGTAEWIRRTVPEAKIVISIRDPVSRAYSHYLMDIRNRVQHRPFLEALHLDVDTPTRPRRTHHLYVDYGRYCELVARYLKVFGENVYVLFFEEFVEDTRTHLRDVFRFLEVDPSYADFTQLGKHNSYIASRSRLGEALYRRPALRALAGRFVGVIDACLCTRMFRTDEKPSMDPRARQFLEELYSGEAECLERLLGRRVPWSSERQQAEAGIRGAPAQRPIGEG